MARRSLSSSPDIVVGLPPTRRLGGTRREASDRLRFVVGERSIDGWALNKSRGGIRAIVDEPIELGTELSLFIADAEEPRPARIVWIQEEPDGAIVGVEYTDRDGSVSEPPGPASGDAREPEPVLGAEPSASPAGSEPAGNT